MVNLDRFSKFLKYFEKRSKLTKNLDFFARGERRAVGRSENPGVPVLFGGHNLLPLVEIGLTDLPKSGDDRPAVSFPEN